MTENCRFQTQESPFADLQEALIKGFDGLGRLETETVRIGAAISEIEKIASAWKARAERAESVCEYIERYDQVEKLHRLTQGALSSWRELSSDV